MADVNPRYCVIDGQSWSYTGCLQCPFHDESDVNDGVSDMHIWTCLHPDGAEPQPALYDGFMAHCPLSESKYLHTLYCCAKGLYDCLYELYYEIKRWWKK